jgi:predicted DNA-binding transcriptional regulator YafY
LNFNRQSATRPQLYRISYIHKMIASGKYPNAGSLACELEVSQRSILRDVEFMKDSFNAPIEYSALKRGYLYTEPDYSIGLINLTEGELLAIYLGHSLLSKCRGAPYARQVLSAFDKICGQLNDEIAIDFGHLAETITFDLEPLRGEEKQIAIHFAAVAKAIREKRQLKIVHYNLITDKTVERTVDPYLVRYHHGVWYLLAWCHLRSDMRTFAMDRIREMKSTDNKFTKQSGFDPHKFFDDSFRMFRGPDIHNVEIWFSADQAPWIREREWHPTQELHNHPDGSLTLFMQTSGLFSVKRWILSFGKDAKAIAPPELVKSVSAELTKAAGFYENI